MARIENFSVAMETMQPIELARLLAGRNEPSVLEKEALFRQLQRRFLRRRSGLNSRVFGIGGFLSMVGVAAAFVVTLRPNDTASGTAQTIDATEFASRGSETSTEPGVRLVCLDGNTEVTCAVARTLAFEFERLPADARYFAAFAQASDKSIIWYFPEANGTSVALDPTRSLQKPAVRLLSPHSPGDYAIYTVFSPVPVTRNELRASLGSSLSANSQYVVVKRSLTLRGAP